MQDICDRTNSAYNEKTENRQKTRRETFWRELTVQELKSYFGVKIMMGIDKKPSYTMHWQKNNLWQSTFITSVMTRDRFQIIERFLSIGDKSLSDQLSRIRKISNHIQEKSLASYHPASQLSIDESMIGFKGRHSLKQYLPMKPTKWGFKVFLLCESTSGYCLKHKFYHEKGSEEYKPKNLCLELASGFENQGYHIYLDNFYSSVELLEIFYQLGINCTGTIRKTESIFQI